MTTLQPDFIVQFKNNKLGIFDTKGMYKDSKDTKLKAESLQTYIKNQNLDFLFGGIIIQNKNTFYINQKDVYKSFDTNIEDWETTNSIFKS
ncbi:MAG: hypothetical protein E7Y34_02805 [Mycoplasma sp.]|nr:hypothetical protein [Mycoplasma sp.]